jgi:4-hydroxy-tetrahydrodipicolinate synthase
MNFDGIFTPIVTPYKEDFKIDFNNLEKILNHLVLSKVHGIIIGGTTGEYYAQSISERIEILKFAKKIVKNKIPLVAGVGSLRTEDCVFLAKASKNLQYDAILITSPPYSQPTQKENANHALTIDRSVDMPILLYNFPGKMGSEMGRDYLDTVSKSKNFFAIKESSGSPSKLHLLAKDFPQIQISCGADDQALEFFAWGARSWVCAGSNFAPEIHIALYEACVLKRDFILGREIMLTLLPLLDLLENGGKFVQSVKFCMEIQGMPVGPPRLPLRILNKDEKRIVERVVITMNQTFDNIKKGK